MCVKNGIAGVVAAALAVCAAVELPAAAKVSVGELELATYGFDDADPIPRPESKTWPYARYDGFSQVATNRRWKAVFLENDDIRVTILPEVGGKVWGAEEKKTGKDFIYFNHVAKFRDIAMCGPWSSGGIEFNFGITGHAPYTSAPVDWTVRENADGSVSYFCGLTELICRTTWQVEVRLPATGGAFETRTVWFNGSGLRVPYYQWMNAGFGVKRENPEFVFPGRNFIGHEGDAHPWPADEEGRLISVYSNNTFGVDAFPIVSADHKSYHVINGDARFFGVWWPKAGLGAYHVNETGAKYGRKIWLWGLSRSGGVWEDLLTDDDGQYVELQSGRCFQQPQDGCWQTPFRYPSFTPGRTDRFVEKWGVVSDRRDFDSRFEPQADVVRPTQFPADFDWNGAYGLWLKANAARFSGLRRGGVRKGLDREAAEGLYRESLKRDPCFVPSLVSLGGFLFELGRTDEALDVLDKALAVDAYEAEANYLEGLIAAERGRRTLALDRFGLASYSSEFRAAALTEMAKAYLAERDWTRAADRAQEALQANPDERDAIWALAVARRKGGSPEQARAIVCAALDRLPLCHVLRYEASRLGCPGDYRENIRNALPAESFLDMAGLYERAGLADEARELFASPGGGIVAAIRSAYLTRDAEAVRRAAALPVDGATPHRRESIPALAWAASVGASWKFDYLLALAFDSKGRERERDACLARCGEKPDIAAFYVYRALRHSGDSAKRDLARAAAIADGWRVGLALAKTCLKESDWAAAREVLQAYLKRYPANPGLRLGYARALVATGAHEEAVRFLESAAFLPSELGEKPLPIYLEALAALADKAVAAGDDAAARAAIRKMLDFPETLGSGRIFDFERRILSLFSPRVRAYYELTFRSQHK